MVTHQLQARVSLPGRKRCSTTSLHHYTDTKYDTVANVTCMRSPDTRCMYCWLRCALRSSLRWANATYSGFETRMRPFISVTALVASSGELKHTKPNPFDRPPSYITWLQIQTAALITPFTAHCFHSSNRWQIN